MLNRLISVFGIGLFALGAWTFVFPEVFTQSYGLVMPDEQSRSLVRALIGGSEMGLGFAQIFHRRMGLDPRTLGIVIIFLLGGLVVARGVTMVGFGGWGRTGAIELLLELGCMAIMGWALMRHSGLKVEGVTG